jgi:hypothetical protein
LATANLSEAQRLKPQALADLAHHQEAARRSASVHPDPVSDRALAWRKFATSAIDQHGEPITDEISAVLIPEQNDNHCP